MDDPIRSLLGSPEQYASVHDVTYNEGPEKGTRVIWLRNAAGLELAVHPDRGMDIGQMLYRGVPLTWQSMHGCPGPWSFARGLNDSWLDTFAGGLLTTCGLTFMGKPGRDGEQMLGLHGNVSHIPARQVATEVRGTVLPESMLVKGVVSESLGFFQRLDLHRHVTVPAQEAVIEIEDVVINSGAEPTPLMVLYHMNFGYPLIQPSSTQITWPAGGQVLWGDPEDSRFGIVLPPQQRGETVAQMEVEGDVVFVHIDNQALLGGVRVTLSFKRSDFPYLFHWRLFQTGAYGIAVEPSTAGLEGRAAERQLGRVDMLEPGESRHLGVKVSATPLGGTSYA